MLLILRMKVMHAVLAQDIHRMPGTPGRQQVAAQAIQFRAAARLASEAKAREAAATENLPAARMPPRGRKGVGKTRTAPG